MTLSEHFTLEEMTISQEAVRSGLRNTPDALQTESLRLLCVNVLEPLRVRVKRPVVVSSGFRSSSVNRRIGGSQRSQHCRGEAADLTIPGMSVTDVVALIRKMSLPFDQLIDEFGAWVHVSHSRTGKQRHQVLAARRVGGKTEYQII
jgi:zinc D-Ala-D-Ala carboxypeptidase